jgi:hypothetical protein
MSLITSSPLCSLTSAKIMFVLMIGQQGTEIRDETPTNTAISIYRNRQHMSATLYESTVNVLRIQLDCSQQYRDDSLDYGCSLGYQINVWIDLNDDEKFDEVENRVHHRSLIQGQGPRGTYDLEICIPLIDDTNTRAGPHRMRISLMTSEDYRKKCDNTGYSETREYTVNVIPKAICGGKIYSLISLLECESEEFEVHVLISFSDSRGIQHKKYSVSDCVTNQNAALTQYWNIPYFLKET